MEYSRDSNMVQKLKEYAAHCLGLDNYNLGLVIQYIIYLEKELDIYEQTLKTITGLQHEKVKTTFERKNNITSGPNS